MHRICIVCHHLITLKMNGRNTEVSYLMSVTESPIRSYPASANLPRTEKRFISHRVHLGRGWRLNLFETGWRITGTTGAPRKEITNLIFLSLFPVRICPVFPSAKYIRRGRKQFPLFFFQKLQRKSLQNFSPFTARVQILKEGGNKMSFSMRNLKI